MDPRYQTALNIAAGNPCEPSWSMMTRLRRGAPQHLKRNGLGRATFLPLTKMLDGRRERPSWPAKDRGFCHRPGQFDEIPRGVLVRARDTVVVDTLDKARRLMGGVRWSPGRRAAGSSRAGGRQREQSQLRFGAAAKGKIEEGSAS